MSKAGGISEGRFSEGSQLGLDFKGAETLTTFTGLDRMFDFGLRVSVKHLRVAVRSAQAHYHRQADEKDDDH